MFRLHIYTREGDIDRTLEIPGETVTIGRSSECDVVLERADVSRRHVELRRGIVVEDLGSRNGTHVEGERVDQAVTLRTMRVEIGDPTSNPIVIEILETGSRPGSRPPARTSDTSHGEGSRPGRSARGRRRSASGSAGPASDPGSLGALKAELAAVADTYKRQRTEMQRELEELRTHLAELREASGARAVLDAQAAENERLKRRIAELERDR